MKRLKKTSMSDKLENERIISFSSDGTGYFLDISLSGEGNYTGILSIEESDKIHQEYDVRCRSFCAN